MTPTITTIRRSNGRRYIPAKVTGTRSLSREWTPEEVQDIYNQGQSLIEENTEKNTENRELHHCTQLTARYPMNLGYTDLVCNNCIVVDCITGDTDASPFYGFTCTVCGRVSYSRETDDFLDCKGFCKYGRPIIVYWMTCESCRDFVERKTMGAFRPFQERKP